MLNNVRWWHRLRNDEPRIMPEIDGYGNVLYQHKLVPHAIPTTEVDTYLKAREIFPEVWARSCVRRGSDSIEVNCPYCGINHYHSPCPTPDFRKSHCAGPRFPLGGGDPYYIIGIYSGKRQPNKPKDWINCRGDKVPFIDFRRSTQ